MGPTMRVAGFGCLAAGIVSGCAQVGAPTHLVIDNPDCASATAKSPRDLPATWLQFRDDTTGLTFGHPPACSVTSTLGLGGGIGGLKSVSYILMSPFSASDPVAIIDVNLHGGCTVLGAAIGNRWRTVRLPSGRELQWFPSFPAPFGDNWSVYVIEWSADVCLVALLPEPPELGLDGMGLSFIESVVLTRRK